MVESMGETPETMVYSGKSEEMQKITGEPTKREWRNRAIIGLGGQGCKIVDAIVTEMKKEMNGKPLPENIRFAAIDTHRKDIEENITNKEVVKIKIDVSDRDAISNKNRWLPSRFLPSGGEGAGMYRCFGKAAYVTKKPQIERELDGVFDDLFNTTHSSDFFVIIATALGGGTGSSMITELALDVRERLRNRYNDPFIVGIGILPSNEGEDANQLANSCASLKELHYLMSKNEPIMGGGQRFINPYKIFFLVSRQIRGVTRDKELKESLMHFLMDVGFVPTGVVEDTKDKMLDPNDLWTKATNHEHQFSSLGYFQFMFPYHRLRAYFKAEQDIPLEENKLEKLKHVILAKEGEIREFEDRLIQIQMRIDERSNLIDERSRGFLTFASKEVVERAIEERDQYVERKDILQQRIRPLKERVLKLERMRAAIERRIENIKLRKARLFDKLLHPDQSPHLYTTKLEEREIDYLRGRREHLQYSYLKEVMEWLRRGEEYLRNTHETVSTADVVRRPMLNYKFTFETKAFEENIPKEFMNILMRNDLVMLSSEGLFDFSDPTTGEIMLFLATFNKNYDMGKLNMASFEDNIKTNYRQSPLVKPLRMEETKKYYFDVYLFMIGLRPWSPLPNELPPRLEEFSYIEPIYKKEVQANQILKHHALFLGNPALYKAVTKDEITLDGFGNTEDILKFWINYEIIDEDAKWFLVPIVLAKTFLFSSELTKNMSLAKRSFDLLSIPEEEKFGDLEDVLDHIGEFLDASNKAKEFMERERQELDRYRVELRDCYDRVSDSVKAPNGKKVVELIEKIAAPKKGKKGELERIMEDIDDLRNLYHQEIHPLLNDLQNFCNSFKDRDLDYELKRKKNDGIDQIRDIRERSVEISLSLGKLRSEVKEILNLVKKFEKIRALEPFLER